MKKTILILAAVMLGSVTVLQAKESKRINISEKEKTETATFGVRGNCGMCKATIEKAANSVKGVSKSEWNRETKKLTVSYDSEKTSLEAIHQAIAKSGYDTELMTAQEPDYNNLPGCCQYDREMPISVKKVKTKKKESKSHEGHNH